LQQLTRGWKSYFSLAETPRIWLRLDEWTRHRIRALQLKQWKRGTTAFKKLRALGASVNLAAMIASELTRWWHNSGKLLHQVLTVEWFDTLGVLRLVS
jgi:RNA-directed DNA polymerase